ncbi:MAG: DUF4867 family protein [Oscillospiraceae bacterium]|nr:DUF4867 family protein [Oscillospiraceae bacterium]
MLEKIKKLNPDLQLFRIGDTEFSEYGRLLSPPCDLNDWMNCSRKISMPVSGSMYLADIPELHVGSVAEWLRCEVFGQMHTEFGLCQGFNNRLNALEWHKSSEVNVALTRFVLLLGRVQDIENSRYDETELQGFLAEPRQCFEIYATTLHFCPCQIEKKGFRCIVALPDGTNQPLKEQVSDSTLFRRNKWILAHEDNSELISHGAKPGVYGKNRIIVGV